MKCMFDDPLSLQGVHSSNFHSKMQKITVLACPLAKNSTASQKNCTDVFAPSARFYNFAHDCWSTDDINDENDRTEIFVIALFVSKKCPCQCLFVSSCKRQSSCDSWCSHAPSWVALSAVAKSPPTQLAPATLPGRPLLVNPPTLLIVLPTWHQAACYLSSWSALARCLTKWSIIQRRELLQCGS